jgi:hypothetical protein
MKSRIRIVAFGILLAVPWACDLEVLNENNPDRNRALVEPEAVEGLIAGNFSTFYGTFYRRGSSNDITVGMHVVTAPAIGEEFTTTYYTDGRCNPTVELAAEPRQQLNNDPVSCSHDLQELTFERLYLILSNSNDLMKAVTDRGLVLETGSPEADNTERDMTFAKFWQGVGLGMLGVIFDKAWIVDENSTQEAIDDPRGKLELVEYPALIAAGVAALEESANRALSAPAWEVTIPGDWLNSTQAIDNALLARLARSFAARIMVLGARTPQERDALDWTKVIQLIDNGLTADYSYNMQSPLGSQNEYLAYAQANSGTRTYADINLIGESDVSGGYQAWVAKPVDQREKFLITTPDRRITGASPTTNGAYFRYQASDPFDRAFGSYHGSFYQWYRTGGVTNRNNWPLISRTEMNLYKAEGLARTGQGDAAAALANLRRTAVGQLPELTAAGVPEASDCVPRTAAGACGTLLDGIRYERQIEQAGTFGMYMWLDRRGWGSLPRNTPIHLPIPGEQLEILQIGRYTFGGGGPGSSQ